MKHEDLVKLLFHSQLKWLALAIIVFFILCPPIPQNPAYHAFADQRQLLHINNALNVLSNIMFIAAGIYAMLRFNTDEKFNTSEAIRISTNVFFFGVILIGIGSAYYHANPNNQTLLWDRLPMSIALMAFFNLVIAAFIDQAIAKKLLTWMLLTGVVSVFYWYFTELAGHGDLRFYGLVQFIPLLITPYILYRYQSNSLHKKPIVILLLFYFIAKVFELGDIPLFNLTGWISGHTIKHLISGFAPLLVLYAIIPNSSNQHD